MIRQEAALDERERVVNYRDAHRFIVKLRGRADASRCQWLGCEAQAQEWAFLHTCPSIVDERGREYSTDPDCYVRLCRPHHRREDAEVRRYRREKKRAALTSRPVLDVVTALPGGW